MTYCASQNILETDGKRREATRIIWKISYRCPQHPVQLGRLIFFQRFNCQNLNTSTKEIEGNFIFVTSNTTRLSSDSKRFRISFKWKFRVKKRQLKVALIIVGFDESHWLTSGSFLNNIVDITYLLPMDHTYLVTECTQSKKESLRLLL